MNREDIQKLMEAYNSVVSEKTLTPAEKKKREEIAKAMEKDNPDMPMDKKMAIATAQAKKVAEEKEECPKCEGEGCDHCDGKGYHDLEEGNYAIYKKGKVFDTFSSKADAEDSLNSMGLSPERKKEYRVRKLPANYKADWSMKEEVELEEGPDYLGDIRRKKERDEKKKASQHAGETQRQKMMRKVYGKAMGGLKKEEVELDEISGKLARKAAASSASKAFDMGNYAYDKDSNKEADRLQKKADKAMAHVQKRQGEKGVKKVDRLANKLVYGRSRAFESADSVEESLNEELWKEIETYAKKHGGIDKKDMLKVAMMLKKGDRKGAVKYARGLDTDPRDWLLDKMDESVEQDLESLDEKSCGKDRMKKESDDEDKKLDPVNKKAVKKDFDDRDDKDIDNDGDVDGSDEYLHNRRKAVGKAMSKDKKGGKTAEISKIDETGKKVKEDVDFSQSFEELWGALSEAMNPKKGATPPEEMDSKDSPKAKEFKKQHSVDFTDEEDTHETGTKAGRATKPAPARPGDNKAGDKNIVNPVKGAVKEDTRTYQQKIMDILSGKTWGEIADNVEELKGEE